MAFSGLSPVDVIRRKYGDFKDDLETGISPLMLTIRRKKSGNEFITFVPDQTIRYLKEWLNYRQSKGEKLDDDTPIFFWTKTLSMIIKQTEYIKKSGVKIRNGFRMRNYCFRKYFRRGLMGNVDESLAEFFMGHTVDLPGIYSGLVDLDPEAIAKAKKEYEKALPDLVTEGKVSIRDFTDLKNRMEQLERENMSLKERLNGFQYALNSLSPENINHIAEVLARALENKKKKS
jgi:integrase